MVQGGFSWVIIFLSIIMTGIVFMYVKNIYRKALFLLLFYFLF